MRRSQSVERMDRHAAARLPPLHQQQAAPEGSSRAGGGGSSGAASAAQLQGLRMGTAGGHLANSRRRGTWQQPQQLVEQPQPLGLLLQQQ